MSALNDQLQRTITLSQQEYMPILFEGFPVDRKAQGLSSHTIGFYEEKLNNFLAFCEGQAITRFGQIFPEFIRSYILHLSNSHNPGGRHAAFRSVRAFLYW